MVNVAIIGCGAVLEDLHASPIRKLVRAGAINIVALVDNNAARAARMQRDFPNAGVFTSQEEAYAGKAVQLTFVASPPGLHCTHGLAALAAGTHLFLEKPMVTNGVDAERLTSAARQANRVLAVGLPRRFYPHVADVAGLIARGELGDGITFTHREGAPFDWPVTSEAVFTREKSGGGVLIDKGAHALDTLDEIFGAAEVVRCEDDSSRTGVESNARVELNYPGCKARGVVQLSWDQALNSGLWIRGSRGEVALGLDDLEVYRHRAPGGVWRNKRATATWPATVAPTNPKRGAPNRYQDCVYFEWVNALRAVNFGEPPAVDGMKATRIIQTIETAYKISQPLDLPWLSAGERATGAATHWRATV